MPATTATPQPGDVIRARRYGNRTVGNYVIDRNGTVDVGPDVFSAYAHREYGTASQYMTFDATTMRVIRSYR